MATLTALGATNGWTGALGSLDTSGYVAVIPAFQKVYFASGQTASNNGYCKLDFLNTKLTFTTAPNGAWEKGEILTQAASEAVGIYDECIDLAITGTITGTFVLGEKVTQAVTGAIGYVAKANISAAKVWVFQVSGTFATGANAIAGATASLANPSAISTIGAHHFIYRTTTAEFNNSNVITGSINGYTGTPAVVTAPPHWLPWTPAANTFSDTGGILPDGGSNIGCLCFGRIFLNSMLNPHQWFCSRVFDPLDWDSALLDVAAPTYSQSAKAGEVGNPIVAMVSYKDHYLIWGCANEMWLLQSDPLMGGVNRCLSKSTGMFSPASYCWDDKNNFYFLGTDGIYALSAEAIINASPPINLTKERNPKLITSLGLNRRTDRVAMGYDKQRYGIKISVTQQDGTWSVEWWMDLRTGGLFPEKYNSDHRASSLFYYDSYNAGERGLLTGCYDGYIRKEDETVKNDDDLAIESHVTLGPIVSGGEPRETVGINETSLVLGEESDGVMVDFYRGTSADEVVSNVLNDEASLITRTLEGDSLKNSVINRVSGRAVAVRIKNETLDETYSIEEINLSLQSEGRKKE